MTATYLPVIQREGNFLNNQIMSRSLDNIRVLNGMFLVVNIKFSATPHNSMAPRHMPSDSEREKDSNAHLWGWR